MCLRTRVVTQIPKGRVAGGGDGAGEKERNVWIRVWVSLGIKGERLMCFGLADCMG